MILLRALALALVMLCAYPTASSASPQPSAPFKKGVGQGKGVFARHSRGAPATPERPYDVKHYHLDITLDPTTQVVHGSVTLTLTPDIDLGSLELDFRDLQVKSVSSEGEELPFTHTSGLIQIDHPFSLDDEVDVTLEFGGTPRQNEEGLGLWLAPKGSGSSTEDLAFSIFEPDGARQLFPCNDIPSDKATFSLVGRVPKGWLLASNGLLTETEDLGETLAFHWSETRPIATYLITLNAGPYEVWEDEDSDAFPIVYYSREAYRGSAALQWSQTAKQLAFFEGLFGPYPFDKYGTVEAPMPFAAMEHQSLTLWRTSLFTSLAGSPERAWSISAHEVAHHWFGNLVTPARWEEIWLNEGFATYGEALWAEEEGGSDALANFMITNNQVYIRYKGQEETGSLYDPLELFGVTSYQKGAGVLHMLRRHIGDQAFFQGVNTYLGAHAYGNATTEDLRAAFEGASGRDLSTFFDNWVYRAGQGVPNLTFGFDVTSDGVDIGVAQKGATFTLPLPIRVVFKDGTIKDVDLLLSGQAPAERFTLKSEGAIRTIMVDPDGWALASVEESRGVPGESCSEPQVCDLGEPCPDQIPGAACLSGDISGCGGCNGAGEEDGSEGAALFILLGLGLMAARPKGEPLR